MRLITSFKKYISERWFNEKFNKTHAKVGERKKNISQNGIFQREYKLMISFRLHILIFDVS